MAPMSHIRHVQPQVLLIRRGLLHAVNTGLVVRQTSIAGLACPVPGDARYAVTTLRPGGLH